MKQSGDSTTNLVKEREMVGAEDKRENESSPVTMHTDCGLGRCRPRFLQIFANPIVFMIILNIYCLVEGAIVSGEYTMSCISAKP